MSSTPGPSTRPTAAATSSSSAQKPSEAPSFTAEMRDRQARGKDPYTNDEDEDEEEDDEEEEEEEEGEEEDDEVMDLDEDEDEEEEEEDDGLRMQLGSLPKNETYEERQTRQFALAVLDSPEQLMMYAQSTNDSIPGQRYRFMMTLCGFTGVEDKQQRAARRR